MLPIRALILFGFAAACGSEAEPVGSEPAEVTEVTAVPVVEPAEPIDEGPSTQADPGPDDPPPNTAALEEMERGELEAACFEGSSAACDQLGH